MNDFLAKIRSADDEVRTAAWRSAGECGPEAIKPLAALLTDGDMETARAAKRALWTMVRHYGRPGAGKQTKAIEKELAGQLGVQSAIVRREVLWMLSEIGSQDAVKAMADMLSDKEVREDARCALLRLPGKRVTEAFKQAFATAPEDFKHALADSLRLRGEKVNGYPTKRHVPERLTTVVPHKTG